MTIEYISREAAIKKIAEAQDKATSGTEDVTYYRAIKIIRDMPAADVQSVKRGHWDYSEKENGECEWYFCPECDSPAEQLYDDNPLLSEFCPHCGADMRGESNGRSS